MLLSRKYFQNQVFFYKGEIIDVRIQFVERN